MVERSWSRPQSRALAEAAKPAGSGRVAELEARVAELERKIAEQAEFIHELTTSDE